VEGSLRCAVLNVPLHQRTLIRSAEAISGEHSQAMAVAARRPRVTFRSSAEREMSRLLAAAEVCLEELTAAPFAFLGEHD
jgi:hypothetical protein